MLNVSALVLPLCVGFFCTFGIGVLIVVTTRWHGIFSLDEAVGVQKVHSNPTSRIGGLPIVLGLSAAILVSPVDLQRKLWLLIVAGMPAFAFGFAEDLTKRVSVLSRLLATMGSGVLGWYITGYSLTSVNVLGVDWLLQFTLVSVLFTAFAVGGIANAINIIDGLNGLASSMVIWAILGVAILANALGDVSLSSTCLLLASCVLGFFLINWPLGKLFLGDGGSYFLGFSLAWVCVLLIERNTSVSAFAPLLLCIHPVTEVLYSIYRRRSRQQYVGHPDRLHFHSLVKRRIMPRLLPNGSKTLRNSVGGVLVGSISMLPALIVQFVYASTQACLIVCLVLVLLYLWLFKGMVRNFGGI